MSKSAYPTADDLTSLLTSAGFPTSVVSALGLADAVAAGIADFEGAARRKMLSGAEETRYFDPPSGPRGLLFLREADLASLTSVVYQPTGSEATTFEENVDFWLLPYNAADLGQPYTRIQFARRWLAPITGGLRRSLQLTGTWGYGASFPEDAWLAMLARGAWRLWPQLTQVTTGGRLSFKQADVSEDFGVETWTRLRDGWERQFTAAASRYRKVVL